MLTRLDTIGTCTVLPGPKVRSGAEVMTVVDKSHGTAARKRTAGETMHFIDGAFTAGSGRKTFENRSPVDNTLVSTVHEASAEDVDAAVGPGGAALQGPWGKMALADRVRPAARGRRRDHAPLRRFPRRRGRRHRQAGEPGRAYRHSARRRQLQVLRRRREERADRVLRDGDARRQRRAQLCAARAAGRGRASSARGTCRCC